MKRRRPLLITGLAGLVLLSLAGVGEFLRYTEGDVNELLHDPRHKNDQTRTLIVMLDGVPYKTMNTLWQQGYFRIFKRPSRVIASFPSMTNVAAAEIWQAGLPEGYESLYFDRASSVLRGGATTYLRKRVIQAADYHQELDYVEPKAYEFAVYGFSRRINRADMRRFFLAYATSEKPIFKAFLKSTDGLTHIGGEDVLKRSLIELDALLNKIYQDRDGRLEIIVFSDHGNHFTRCQRVDLEGHLQRHGFDVRDRLGEPSAFASRPIGSEGGMKESGHTVVIPDFGLVGYAALYTSPSNRRPVAEAVAEMDEVAVVAYADGKDVHVLGGSGVARISYDQRKNSFRYEAVRGDPLDLAKLIDQFKREGKMLDDGYVADPVWFEALTSHRYPDALFRLYQGINGLVKNRADVLVSFKDGFVYGSRLFQVYDRLVPVVAIHGGLAAAQSETFFMSTAREVPPYLRAREVRNYFENH